MDKTITMPLNEYEQLKKDALNWKDAQYFGNTEKLAESINDKLAVVYGKDYYNAKARLRSKISELKLFFKEESHLGFIHSGIVLEKLEDLEYKL
jgi:hypothetical protein